MLNQLKIQKAFLYYIAPVLVVILTMSVSSSQEYSTIVDSKNKKEASTFLRFRSYPTILNYTEVESLFIKYDFFNSYKNQNGRGFPNQFEVQIIMGDKVTIDYASGLIWQQSSPYHMRSISCFVKGIVKEVNRKGYAGYYDWRLPTLEEAMSLVEPKRSKRHYNDNNGGYYIDSIFDREIGAIWTSDLYSSRPPFEFRNLVVSFITGEWSSEYCTDPHDVLLVRSNQTLPDKKQAQIILRSTPQALSENDVKKMLEKYGFYCGEYIWNESYRNPYDRGYNNQFLKKWNGQLVYDYSSGLTWQQSGSSKPMSFEEAKEWIATLNRDGYAGYNDWRLPTLEEAMSLMEPSGQGILGYFPYIDLVFDEEQRNIWTSDFEPSGLRAWVASYYAGCCFHTFFSSYFMPELMNDVYVRAVR